jgi:hypothetical protein
LLKAGLALVVGGVTVSIGGIFDPLAMVGGVAALSIAGVWVFQSRKFSSRSRSIADDDAPNGPAEGQSIECTVESTQSRLTDHLGRAGDAIDADFSSMREELREAATSEPDVSEMSVDAELDAFERDLLESNRSAT